MERWSRHFAFLPTQCDLCDVWIWWTGFWEFIDDFIGPLHYCDGCAEFPREEIR